MSRTAEATARAELAWWAWHDADSSRWSPELGDAEERCAAWVAGDSSDGPEPVDPEDEAACDAEIRAEHDADVRRMAGDE